MAHTTTSPQPDEAPARRRRRHPAARSRRVAAIVATVSTFGLVAALGVQARSTDVTATEVGALAADSTTSPLGAGADATADTSRLSTTTTSAPVTSTAGRSDAVTTSSSS